MGLRREAFYPFLGDGLFTQDGPSWKISREILRRQFARIQYTDLTVFTNHVEQLVERFSKLEAVADLQPFFFSYTLDTTTALLFGESADTLNEDSDDRFAASWDLASWISAVRVKLLDFYWVYKTRRYTAACDEVKKYAEKYIEKALTVDEADTEALERYSFIRNLHTDLPDLVKVRDQLINVLLAGRDTTACLLSWTL